MLKKNWIFGEIFEFFGDFFWILEFLEKFLGEFKNFVWSFWIFLEICLDFGILEKIFKFIWNFCEFYLNFKKTCHFERTFKDKSPKFCHFELSLESEKSKEFKIHFKFMDCHALLSQSSQWRASKLCYFERVKWAKNP